MGWMLMLERTVVGFEGFDQTHVERNQAWSVRHSVTILRLETGTKSRWIISYSPTEVHANGILREVEIFLKTFRVRLS